MGAKGLRRVGMVYLLLLVPALYLAKDLAIDNRVERWIAPSEHDAQNYAHFRETFGSDEFIVAAISGETLLSEDALESILDVVEAVEEIPDVRSVVGIPSVFRDQFGSEDIEDLRREIHATPYYRKLFISDDEGVLGILIQTQLSNAPEARRAIVDAVSEAFAPLELEGYRVDLVGAPTINANLDLISQKESVRTFPIAVAASILVLLGLFRSWRATAVAILCAGITIVLTMGFIGATGRSLNMISAVLPSLLWVLALANVIHLLVRYRRHRATSDSVDDALNLALGEVAFPIALSAITTACGFLSLLMASMEPVRELAAFAAVGMLFSLATNLTVGPFLISLLRVGASSPRTPAARTASSRPWFVFGRPRVAAVIALGLCGTATLLALDVKVESNPLSYFPSNAPILRAYTLVERELAGGYSLEVVCRTPEPWTDPSVAQTLDDFQTRIEEHSLVPRVFSALDTLKLLRYWNADFEASQFAVPESRDEAEGLLDELSDTDRSELHRYVDESGTTLRLSVLVNDMDSTPFMDLVEKVHADIAQLPAGYSAYVSGTVLQLVTAQDKLVATQLKSFALAFAIIFLCLLVGLRSWKLVLLSVIPNTLPILAAFSAMTLLGIPLDAATVMVASVALGIAVDDTVHFLGAFRRHQRLSNATMDNVRATLGEVGPSMTVTTLTACIGFLVLTRSAFAPIGYFGILSTIALTVALVADLILLPSLIFLLYPKNEEGAV